jgi:hypothetical protein
MFDIREGSGASIMLSVQPFGFLAAAPRDPSEWVGPGLLGFVVIVSLGVATFLLWRNMNKQLRRVRFEEQPRPGDGDEAPPSASRSDRPGGENTAESPVESAVESGGEDGGATHRDR